MISCRMSDATTWFAVIIAAALVAADTVVAADPISPHLVGEWATGDALPDHILELLQ